MTELPSIFEVQLLIKFKAARAPSRSGVNYFSQSVMGMNVWRVLHAGNEGPRGAM